MKKNNRSYSQILKSTTIVGGSQFASILIGLVRIKVAAILLGPAGIGIMGMYQSIVDMLRTGSSLGLDTSAIRTIAISADRPAQDKNKVITIFSLWFVALSLLGLLLGVLFSYPISIWVFDDKSYALPVALLSIVVCLTILVTGKSVVLQSLRKIFYLAKSSVWASLGGLLVSIPLFYFLGVDGIILSMLITAIVTYCLTNYYYRKLNLSPVAVSRDEFYKVGLESFKLGIFILLGGVLNTLSLFLIRSFVLHESGLVTAGFFQSVWAIINVYMALVLRSMGTDYYPRLSALNSDYDQLKKLVNEQTYIVLLISSPLVVGLLLFSEFVLSTLYSSAFTYGDMFFQWMLLASFIKAIGWPLSFILLVKNKGRLFLVSEFVFYFVFMIASYFLYLEYQLAGIGIAYLVAYLIYFPLIVLMCYKVSEFLFSKEIVCMALIYFSLILFVFLIRYFSINNVEIIGVAILFASLLYTFLKLRKVFSIQDFRSWFRPD